MNNKINFIASILFLYFFTFAVQAAQSAGNISEIKGSVWAQLGDQPARVLAKGDAVYAKEEIKTGSRARVKLIMNDKSEFDLSANATLQISDFRYKHPGEEDSISMKIVKGTFRFFSGLIAKNRPNAMQVQTAVATIGIRGTHVVGEATETSSTIILMEPKISEDTSIVVFNDFGEVTIDEPGYGTEIPDANSPPSPPRRMRLQTINNITRSIQSINRISTPRPRMR